MPKPRLTPTYPVTCPLCTGALYPVVLDPASAPWVCVICRHGWWVAELQQNARQQFRPELQDFGLGPQLAALQQQVVVEQQAAVRRGSSCRLDQLALVPLAGLQYLAQMNPDPSFMVAVQAEIKRKGG